MDSLMAALGSRVMKLKAALGGESPGANIDDRIT